MRAWSATSEAIALSGRTNPVVMRRVLGALRDAVLGSSRASTPAGRSQAQVVDQISLLDVRTVLGDGSLLAAHSRRARGCALCVATSQPDRGGQQVHLRDGRLEGRCYLTEGYLIFLQVDGDSIAAKPRGARSTASAIARAAGAGGGADAARGHCRHLAALQLVTGVRRGA
jgi:hypothetical protein